MNDIYEQIMQKAYDLGATQVSILRPDQVVIDPELANRCIAPRCENYGLSKSCPPHVAGPEGFKGLSEKASFALLFRIDIPTEIFYSSDRQEVFRLLHVIASEIEMEAASDGYTKSEGFAGGSCKALFCSDYPECAAITENGKCRNPKSARPSMSGFGINVKELYRAAGWKADEQGMSSVCGMVLIG